MASSRVMGGLMLIFGILLATVYPYVVLYTDASEVVMKITIAVTVFLIGSFIAGMGIALIIGWREMEERKRSMASR